MKIRFKDLGEHRWLCRLEMNTQEESEFRVWLKETMPDTKINFILSTDSEHAGLIHHYELRGGDIDARHMISLRWSGN